MTDAPRTGAVRTRSVTYFHGFDPASVGRYRRIFEAASRRLDVILGDLPDAAPGWTVSRGQTQTQIHHARYEDLVHAFQDASLNMRLGRGMRTLAAMMVDGTVFRLAQHAPRALALALSPVLFMVLPFLLIASLLAPVDLIDVAILAALGIGLLVLADRLFLLLVADLFAYFREIAHGTSDAASQHHARVIELAESVRTDCDETLIVGHSLGGIAAIHAAAKLLDRLAPDQALGLLTLGSNHGIVLLQPGAGRDRLAEAILRICTDRRITWIDVSSPRDAFCVPLTDPLVLIDPETEANSPRILSAQLARAPRIPGDRRTAFAAMRRHMGYLLEPTAEGGFDYADTVTGEHTLAARFADRHDSPKARLWRR
ncbi:MAG: hypothetical protein AAFP68_04730 [Pseudomonadota bacterium]